MHKIKLSQIPANVEVLDSIEGKHRGSLGVENIQGWLLQDKEQRLYIKIYREYKGTTTRYGYAGVAESLKKAWENNIKPHVIPEKG